MDSHVIECVLKHITCTKRQVQLSLLNRAFARVVSTFVRDVLVRLNTDTTESVASWVCRQKNLRRLDLHTSEKGLEPALNVLAIAAGVHRDSLETLTLRAPDHTVDSLLFLSPCRALVTLTVHCAAPRLTLPALPETLEVLRIVGKQNEFGEIAFGPNCSSVRILVLASCGLRHLSGDLTYLKNLETLVLKGNRLSHTMNLFALPRCLQKLSLCRCSLVRLPSDLTVLRNLAELDVSYNSIGSGSLAMLDTLPSLKTLDLSHNCIHTLAGLRLSSLEHLDVSCNIDMHDAWADPDALPCLKFLMVSEIPHCDLKNVEILGLHGWCTGYEPPYNSQPAFSLPRPHAPNLKKIVLYGSSRRHSSHISVSTVHMLMDLVRRYPCVELAS